METIVRAHRTERGFTLIETMVVVGMSIALLVAVGMSVNHARSVTRSAVTVLKSSIEKAQAIAQTSSNGATIEFLTRTGGQPGYDVYVCSGRPGTAFLNSCKEEEAIASPIGITPPGGSAITTQWALYINSDTSVAAGTYPAGASEPSCPSGQSITVNLNSKAIADPTIDCATGRIAGLP